MYSTKFRNLSLSFCQCFVNTGTRGSDLLHPRTKVIHVILKALEVILHLRGQGNDRVCVGGCIVNMYRVRESGRREK